MNKLMRTMLFLLFSISIKAYAFDYNLVTPPDGLAEEEWEMSYTEARNGFKNSPDSLKSLSRTVTVVRTDSTFYIKGVFSSFPEGWIMGTVNDSIVSFSGLQAVGIYNYGWEGREAYKCSIVYFRSAEAVYSYSGQLPFFSEKMSCSSTDSLCFLLKDDIALNNLQPDSVNCIWADSPYYWPGDEEPSYTYSLSFEYGAKDEGYDFPVYYRNSYTDYSFGVAVNIAFRKISDKNI